MCDSTWYVIAYDDASKSVAVVKETDNPRGFVLLGNPDSDAALAPAGVRRSRGAPAMSQVWPRPRRGPVRQLSKHSPGETAAEAWSRSSPPPPPPPDAASPPAGDGARDYAGTLGTQAIAVHLVQTGHAVTGAYLYARVWPTHRDCRESDPAGQLVLDEKSDGETTGRWHLRPVDQGLAGEWTNPKGTKTFLCELSPGGPVPKLVAGVPSAGPTHPAPGAGSGGCHDGLGRAVPRPDDDTVCAGDNYVWHRTPGGNCGELPDVGRQIHRGPAPSTAVLPAGATGRCEPGEQGGVNYVCSNGFMYPNSIRARIRHARSVDPFQVRLTRCGGRSASSHSQGGLFHGTVERFVLARMSHRSSTNDSIPRPSQIGAFSGRVRQKWRWSGAMPVVSKKPRAPRLVPRRVSCGRTWRAPSILPKAAIP